MPEERKLVTILFADVTGSTVLGEELDPEDIRALMGRYYEHARQVVDAHGGTLEKFIGDAVMAVFGLPQAHGDDAERAVAAALSLQKAVADDSLLTDQFKLRIGVNTGEVVATSEDTESTAGGDFLVTGDTVNVAARLQQCAEPGEVLVGERTRRAARAAFCFGEERRVEVRGKRDPLRVFPVNGPRAARDVTRPPFVGRKQDLIQLDLLRARALEERQPQLVSVIAPAGTGKTRLLEEFLASLDEEDGFRVATARCLPYGQTLAYWPLRGLLDELLDGEVSKQRVADALVAGGHTTEDAGRLAKLVLAALGVESEAQVEEALDRESIFSAWRLLVEALGRDVPRIIIFEDLHWASDSLLDLVEHIMHPRTQAPLLIIALSRPELLDRRPTWGAGRQSFTALALKPLGERQTHELVRRLAEGLPVAIQDRIVERSGGNPFFVTELIRGLAERGITGKAVGGDALPDTVYAAVLARLDLLSSRERSVLQAASVAGRAFQPATIQAAVDDLTSEEVQTAIDGLLGRDLIISRDGGAFTFQHVLIRDVAYGTLSRPDRIRMHAGIAQWLEAYAAGRLDEFSELIAYHYREAVMLSRQSAVPLPLPIEPKRAVFFLERAGELATRSGAYHEGVSHLRSAIGIAPAAEHARLYEKLGDCAAFGDAAIQAYQEALQRWRDEGGGQPLVGARLLRKILTISMRWHGSVATTPSTDELVAWRAEARSLAEASGDEDELWRVRTADLFWPFWQRESSPQETEEGTSVALAAADYFERREDWEFFNMALDAYNAAASFGGDHEARVRAAKRRLNAPAFSLFERGDAQNMLAWAYLDLGAYDQSVAVMRDAVAETRAGEPIAHLGNGISLAALAAMVAGRWQEFGWLRSALAQAWDDLRHDPGAKFLRAGHLALLHVATARGDRATADAAAAVLERLLSVERFTLDRTMMAVYQEDDATQLAAVLPAAKRASPYTQLLAAQFLLERGRPLAAEFLQRARAARFLPFVGAEPVLKTADALAARDGRELERAIAESERCGLISHAARMRIVLAQLQHDLAPLVQARPVLERLEDRQFLLRLEEVEVALRGSA